MTKAETTKVENATATVAVSTSGGTTRLDTQLSANLAAYHIHTAAALARQARSIECEKGGHAFDNAFNPVFWNVSTSVLMAWSALEANINQLFKSFEDENLDKPWQIDRWGFFYIEPVISKYQGLARLKERILPESDEVFENVQALGDFRNALVGFHPDWYHENENHTILCRKLREIIKPLSNVPFPICYLGYESAKWAVITATDFSAHYAKLIGGEDHLAASSAELELP
jgi:hypothetical protein